MKLKKHTASTGVETNTPAIPASAPGSQETTVRSCVVRSPHLRLTQIILADGTDCHNELVQEKEWLLHPSETPLSLSGNLFLVENLGEESGIILIKQAPLPDARTVPMVTDLRVATSKGGGFEFSLLEPLGSTTDSWAVLEYRGGLVDRTRVLHEWQGALRPTTPGHACPRFVTNTWGDRARDSRINAAFVEAEIIAAHRMGADVVQLDDGWQKGTTSNSAYAKERGGVWEGFWKADPRFWDPHPQRFPRGLEPLVALAREHTMHLGLWFAPDSWNEFTNWRKDAERVLELFTTLGIEHFKIDGVKAPTETAQHNLQCFFTTVLEGSRGTVVFDLDITAGVRPGYFGAIGVGPLFVENRYTDWHNYWPHQTLRNLWKLARWVDPRRLRMEFLNNTRNAGKYTDDPLAPACYSPATMFATVMFSNPLGWFEASNLPAAYVDSAAELVHIWRTHREDLFVGTILPIGKEPDGFSYTGFASLSKAHGYVVVFRELHSQSQFSIELPLGIPHKCTWEVLASEGTIASCGDILQGTIPQPLGFLFARFTAAH